LGSPARPAHPRHRRPLDRGGGWPALLLCWAVLSSAACAPRSTLPETLTNDEFRDLIDTISEPAGTFSLSDNFVSNERRLAENARWLRPAGGVYIGVGPEQNFSYIARVRPAMAFVVDIRRENRNLHFLYKALFELSIDRADFVSRLFSRARPAGLESTASADDLFARYDRVPRSPELFGRNAALIREWLLTTRGLPLSQADLEYIDLALKAFYADGPDLHFWGSRAVDDAGPSYRLLMTAKDGSGQSRSFLASEEAFRFVQGLQGRNMIVPVVGDFGGPGALQGVGGYVRGHADVIQAFYGSNVGVYLTKEQAVAFCRNLSALPAAPDAWFIESNRVRSLGSKIRECRPKRD
jgi:hypothetical protein